MARPKSTLIGTNDFLYSTEPWPGEQPESTLRKLLRLAHDGGGTVVSSVAYEASHVLKAEPGVLVSLSGYNAKTSAQWIQVIDHTAVPADAAAAEVFTVNLTGLTPAGLANKYFTCADADGSIYVWFNLDTLGVDPRPEQHRGIAVAIATGDSASQMATKLAAVLEADAKFTSSATGATATVTNSQTGDRADAAAGTSGAVVLTTVAGNTARVPVLTFSAAASSNFTVPLPPNGLPFSKGIVVCNSSTGPAKTIGTTDCFFTAVVR